MFGHLPPLCNGILHPAANIPLNLYERLQYRNDFLLATVHGDAVQNHQSQGFVFGSSVTFLMQQLHLLASQVIVHDIRCTVRKGDFRGALDRDSLALGNVKHVVIPPEWHLLSLPIVSSSSCSLRFQDTTMLAFSLLDVTASFMALLEGQVLARTNEQHLIQHGVRLARCVADGLAIGIPG